VSDEHLHTAARVLRDILCEMHPEHDVTVEVRPPSEDRGSDRHVEPRNGDLTTMSEHCKRCRREAPPVDAEAYVFWEAADDDGGVLCPGCLTSEELAAIGDDMVATGDFLSRCTRCGKPQEGRQEFELLGPNADEFVCNGCLSATDRLALAAQDHAAAEELQRQTQTRNEQRERRREES